MKWFLVLVILLSACKGSSKPGEHAPDEHKHEHGDEHKEARSDEPKSLSIDPGMLRDLRITTRKSEARTASETVAALGELEVNQNAYAEVASPIAARVLEIHVNTGADVEEGQPLVTLLSAELGRARAELESASARSRLATKAVERKRELSTDRLVSERELQDAEAEAAAASADMRAAQSVLRAVGATGDGAKLVLRSPLKGVVIERDVVKGQLADPQKTLFHVGDLSRLWLVAHVFERDAVRVRTGSKAQLSLAALPGRSFEAVVTMVGRAVDRESRTIPVRLEIDNASGHLRPGMSANVALPLGDESGTVVTVPLEALQRVGEAWVVFLPKKAGEFEVREVGRGRELGAEVEVLRGLAAGETVVVKGAFLLRAEADKARGGGDHHDH